RDLGEGLAKELRNAFTAANGARAGGDVERGVCFEGQSAHEASLESTDQAVFGNGIANKIPHFDAVRPQEEAVPVGQRMQEQWNLPQMVLQVVGGKGEKRFPPLDQTPGTQQGVEFRTLNVHFDESRWAPFQDVIEANAIDFERP